MPQQAKVAAFKEFVRKHPKLLEEVRGNKRTWQEIYEEWDIFGEDHEIWDPYLPENKSPQTKKNPRKSPEQSGTKQQTLNLLSILGKIDLNDVQKYASQLNSTLTNVQKLLEQFQKDQKKNPSSQNSSAPYGPNGFPPPGPPGPPGYGPFPPHQNGPPR